MLIRFPLMMQLSVLAVTCLIFVDRGFGAHAATHEAYLNSKMMGEATLPSEVGLKHSSSQRVVKSDALRALAGFLQCFNQATPLQPVGSPSIGLPVTRSACTSPSMISMSASIPTQKVLSELDGPIDVPVRIPKFRWKMIGLFALNSVLLIPIALLIKSVFNLEWLGPNFAVSTGEARIGLSLGLLLLVWSEISERLFPVLREATAAANVITLYCMGGKLVPIRAGIVATLIAAVSATAEELLFRGCLQNLAANVFAWVSVPMGLATQLAVVCQAVLFGVVHAYTPSLAYIVLSALSGIAFGAAFAMTGNILVPIVGHFINNFVSLVVGHVMISKMTQDEQRELLLSDAPIAVKMRRALQTPPKAIEKSEGARGPSKT